MSDLGVRPKVGVLTTLNFITPGTNLWVVTYQPQDLPVSPFEIYKGFAVGPGGYFQMYMDQSPFEAGQNGRVNAYDPTQPMYVRPGRSISLHWSIGTGSAPQVWLYLREPEVGRL